MWRTEEVNWRSKAVKQLVRIRKQDVPLPGKSEGRDPFIICVGDPGRRWRCLWNSLLPLPLGLDRFFGLLFLVLLGPPGHHIMFGRELCLIRGTWLWKLGRLCDGQIIGKHPVGDGIVHCSRDYAVLTSTTLGQSKSGRQRAAN
jgi:hypothetical protein